MTLPKKGSRRITIGNQTYTWIIRRTKGGVDIRAELENNPGQHLLAKIPSELGITNVTPAFVADSIDLGLNCGWEPTQSAKKPFELNETDISTLINKKVVSTIAVQHQIIKKSGRIRFRKFTKGGYDHFKIRLSLTGPLASIQYVEYELHTTFRDPIRISKERAAGFPIEFWTYGEFEVLVTAHFFDGHTEGLAYYLEYSSELPSEDSAYFDETPSNIAGT